MNPLPGRRRVKGLGRVAFIANLQEITAELEAGWPIKAVYDKRAARLGMSYAQFTRYVDQIVRRDRRVGPVAGAGRRIPPPSLPPAGRAVPNAPATEIVEGTMHAGHQPARGFNHDPIERPDDRKRLLGED